MMSDTLGTGKSLFVRALSTTIDEDIDDEDLLTFMSAYEIESYRRLFDKVKNGKTNRVLTQFFKVLLTRSDLSPQILRNTILKARSLLPQRTDKLGFVSFATVFRCIAYVQGGGDLSRVDSLVFLKDVPIQLAKIRGVTKDVDVTLKERRKSKRLDDREQAVQLQSSSKLTKLFRLESSNNNNNISSPEKQAEEIIKTSPKPGKLLVGRTRAGIRLNKGASLFVSRVQRVTSNEYKVPTPTASKVVKNAYRHFEHNDTARYRRMLRNFEEDDDSTVWTSFKSAIPDPKIRNEYKSRIRQEFSSDVFLNTIMSKVVGISSNFDKSSFELNSRRKKAIFVFGPSAAGKSFGIKSNLETLLKIANWDTSLLFHTIDGGQMRESSQLWAEMKLNRMAVIRQKLFSGEGNEDDERFESKTDYRGFTDLYSRYFKKYIHKVKDKMFDTLLLRGSNVIIPDTATSLLKDRTICKIKELAKHGYEIMFSAVIASKAKCEHNGFSRELSEGKKYSSLGWSRAMGKVPQILEKLRNNSMCSNLPGVILDNNDWNKGTIVNVVEPWHVMSWNYEIRSRWNDTDHLSFHNQPSMKIETTLCDASSMNFGRYYESIHEDMISSYSSQEIKGSSASMRRIGNLMGLEYPGTHKIAKLYWDGFGGFLASYDLSDSPKKKKSSESMLSRFKRSLSSKGKNMMEINNGKKGSHNDDRCTSAIRLDVKCHRVFLVDSMSLRKACNMTTGLSNSTIEHILGGASLLILDVVNNNNTDIKLPKEQKGIPRVLRGETLCSIFSNMKSSFYLIRAVDHPAQIRWFFAINNVLSRNPVKIPRPRSLSAANNAKVPKAPMPIAPKRRPKNISSLTIRGTSFDEAEFSGIPSAPHRRQHRKKKGEKSKWKLVDEADEEKTKARESHIMEMVSPVPIIIPIEHKKKKEDDDVISSDDDDYENEDRDHEEMIMSDHDDDEDALRELARLSPGLSPSSSGFGSSLNPVVENREGVIRKKIVFGI